ncbi:proteasome assembly chaperone 2 [Trichomonascus vanleenenianus]|uniref:Add66p n=1 Tax=Trichomonascus vanleenenianus TaxID=2268995 RepID=UPI003ECB446F
MDQIANSVLVIPTVSSGNIAQLAVDLLIHTLGAELVGNLDDRYLYPFAGPLDHPISSDAPTNKISTAADVYYAGGLTVVQLRSPTLPGYKQRFVRETLVPFAQKHAFKSVLLVGSSNIALQTSPIDPENNIHVYSDSISTQLAALDLDSVGKAVQPVPKQLPESGIAVDVLQQLENSCGIIMFAYEGDNFSDAEKLAGEVGKALGISGPSTWIRPQSWSRAYGKDTPIGIEEGLYT